jgi:hypothetical protein
LVTTPTNFGRCLLLLTRCGAGISYSIVVTGLA